jgi:hypothetical protein
MPRIEENLYNALTSSTLVTTYTANRIYPVEVPQEVTFPYISYMRVASNPVNTLTGRTTSLTNALFQVDVFSTSYATSKTLRENVALVLDASTRISGRLENDADSFETVLNTDKKVYVITMDFSLWGQP